MIRNPAQIAAVHESGHAVAALHLGVQFEAVELKIEGFNGMWYCGGRLKGAQLPEKADNQRLWTQLVVIMAGYASVSLLSPPTSFSVRQFTDTDDRDYGAAVDILGSTQPPLLQPREREAAMERAWHDARRVVEANWRRMTAIADELMRLSHPNGDTTACHIVLTPQDLSRLFSAVR